LFSYTSTDQTSGYAPPNIGAGSNGTIYTYDLDRSLTQIRRPDGQLVTIAYDEASRPSSINPGSPSLPLETFGYNATSGKLTAINSADGVTLGYTYNGALLTGMTWTGLVAGAVGKSYDGGFSSNIDDRQWNKPNRLRL
jgi:YD repeat-containing protein